MLEWRCDVLCVSQVSFVLIMTKPSISFVTVMKRLTVCWYFTILLLTGERKATSWDRVNFAEDCHRHWIYLELNGNCTQASLLAELSTSCRMFHVQVDPSSQSGYRGHRELSDFWCVKILVWYPFHLPGLRVCIWTSIHPKLKKGMLMCFQCDNSYYFQQRVNRTTSLCLVGVSTLLVSVLLNACTAISVCLYWSWCQCVLLANCVIFTWLSLSVTLSSCFKLGFNFPLVISDRNNIIGKLHFDLVQYDYGQSDSCWFHQILFFLV